jgi:hypothetical protein
MIHPADIDKIESLLKNKAFIQLSSEEKFWISQWIESETEYENLRTAESQIRHYFFSGKIDAPDSVTLGKLTNHLRRLESKKQTRLSWQLKPSMGALLMSALFGSLGWWIGQSTNEDSQKQTFNTVVVHDTIFVASKPDTIFTEKVVYKNRPVILTRNPGTTDVNKSIEKNGINMKEKEELEKLLVSGTEQ